MLCCYHNNVRNQKWKQSLKSKKKACNSDELLTIYFDYILGIIAKKTNYKKSAELLTDRSNWSINFVDSEVF